MNVIQKLIVSAVTGLLLSSCCNNFYYVNDPVVFANVTRKSDFNLAGGLNGGTLTGGSHLHGNAAISNSLYLSGSFTRYKGSCSDITTENGVTTDNSVQYSGRSFLCGAGYYKALGDNFYFEGSAGGKYGINANRKLNENFQYRHIKYFLQPGITYTKTHFQAGLALRFGVLDYLPYKTGTENRIPEIATQEVKGYFDPAIYICGGGKYVKVGTQVSSTFTDDSNIAYTTLGAVFGLVTADPLSLSVFIKVTIPSKKTD